MFEKLPLGIGRVHKEARVALDREPERRGHVELRAYIQILPPRNEEHVVNIGKNA